MQSISTETVAEPSLLGTNAQVHDVHGLRRGRGTRAACMAALLNVMAHGERLSDITQFHVRHLSS